jgi:hypothetical protein
LGDGDSIYQLLADGLRELGVADPSSATRRILLRDRHLAGIRFDCEGYRTVVTADLKTVRFHGGPNGELLKTATLGGDEQMVKKAA